MPWGSSITIWLILWIIFPYSQMVQLYNCHKSVVRALFETRYTETKPLDNLLAFTRLIIITKYKNERHSRNQKRLSETFDQIANMILVRPIYQISLPSITTPANCFWVNSYWILNVWVSLLRAWIFGISHTVYGPYKFIPFIWESYPLP